MTLPKEVHDALKTAGGTNYRGQPNYRFAWSGHETYLISNGIGYEHFRIVGEDCWLLMKWEPAEYWGTESEWEMNNWEPSGLFTAGPYPREGRYRVIRTLKRAVIKDDVMEFVPFQPTLKFVDDVFPLLRDFLELSTERKAELIATREKNEKETLAKQFGASRELYRGAGTAKLIQQREEAIYRFLNDPDRIREALALKGQH